MHTSRIARIRRPIGLALVLLLSSGGVEPAAATEAATVPDAPTGPLQAAFSQGGLEVTWAKGDHDSFVVVDEHQGTVAASGPDTSYVHDMSAVDSATLVVYGLASDRRVVLGKVQAMQSPAPAAMGDSTMVTTDEGARLSWSGPVDVPVWTVTDAESDASLLKVVPDGSRRDPLVAEIGYDLSDDARIEVTGLTAGDDMPLQLVSGYAITPPKFPASSVRVSLREGDVVPASIPTIVSSRMTYETYIPWPYVDAPDAGTPVDCERGDGSKYEYSGDSRSEITYESPRFRTKGIHEYDWKSKSTWLPRYVLPTRRYIKKDNGDYVYESERTAPMTKFVTSSRTNDGTFASGQTVHSVGNPYCQDVNNIDYYYTHDIYRAHGYHVFGRHDRMPDNFLYRTDNKFDGVTNYSATKTIFHHPLKDPACLNTLYEALFCPQLEYNYEE
jgi:hypothetical protein